MNGIDLYANMCGAELWNRERLSRYMAAGVGPPGVRLLCQGCDGLADLVPCIEDEPPDPMGYELPELDPAPWYDPTFPESQNFAGVLVLEAKLSSPIDRRLVQGVGHGAVLTRARFQGRTITVRALLVGRTCCSVAYGLRWLTQALLGDSCGACDGCTLTFLTCCPASGDGADCLVELDEDGNPVPFFRESLDDEFTRGTDFVRQMHGVGLLSGPDVTECHRISCGSCGCAQMTEVEFTLGVGNPWLYRLQEDLVSDVPLVCEDPDTCTVEWVVGCAEGNLCPQHASCADDPMCLTPVPPPPPRVPLLSCGCTPLVAGRNCFAVPAAGDWFDQVLVVEVYSGDAPLRNVAFRTWPNPQGRECCSDLYFDDCNACATLLVSYVPPESTLTFDSARREVTITCAGASRPAAANVATVEGMPFEWIELGCVPACLAVDVDCANVGTGATVSIKTVGREL